MKVSVAEGKYTVGQTKGEFYALRHGEQWQDLTGNKFVYSLAAEIAELRDVVRKAKNCLTCTPTAAPHEVVLATLNILESYPIPEDES